MRQSAKPKRGLKPRDYIPDCEVMANSDYAISLQAGNFSQSALRQSFLLSVFWAADCFSQRGLCFGDLFRFLVDHCQMILEGWIVRFFRNSKLQLIASQDVTAKFVLDPAQRVCIFGVFRLLLSRHLRPPQSGVQIAPWLGQNDRIIV